MRLAWLAISVTLLVAYVLNTDAGRVTVIVGADPGHRHGAGSGCGGGSGWQAHPRSGSAPHDADPTG